MNKYLLLLFIPLYFLSCKKESDSIPVSDNGNQYLPVYDGYSQSFKINETIFTTFGKEINEYYSKEEYTLLGDGYYRITRSLKDSLAGEWLEDSVFSLTLDDTLALREEHGKQFKILAFPLKESKAWDYNSYNTSDLKTVEVTNFEASFNENGLSFPVTTTIDKGELETLISHEKAFEVYAYDVGLIYQYQKSLAFQPGKDSTGFIFERVILD